MASITLRLVYNGLDATWHRMPTSFVKQITAGAQEFLGAHAYFFAEGKIPVNVLDSSRSFRIDDIRQRDGSWEALFTIELANVASEFVTEYVRAMTKDLAVEAALATKIGFVWLVHRSYKSWSERTPLRDKTFDRIEPVLADVVGNGAPIYDPEIDCNEQRQKLFDRTFSSMAKISSPIGRAADHVDIWLDDQKLDRLQRRIFTDEEIEAALFTLRNSHRKPKH